MRLIFLICLSFSLNIVSAQWKEYQLTSKGDTLNRVDMNGKKQGIWVNRVEALRGEPGYEEEGKYVGDRKEGEWRIYNLMGDLIGIENYKWGLKDGICTYFSLHGGVRMQQSWKALNPDKLFDTLFVEDVDKLNTYRQVIVKNEGAALRHGEWKYFDPETGALLRVERYEFGEALKNNEEELVNKPPVKVEKPKEVVEFEKNNAGKKKVRYQDGSTGDF